MSTIRNKKDLTKLKKDLHVKDIVIYSDDIVINNSDKLLNMIVNIDETGYQYVVTSTHKLYKYCHENRCRI